MSDPAVILHAVRRQFDLLNDLNTFLLTEAQNVCQHELEDVSRVTEFVQHPVISQ